MEKSKFLSLLTLIVAVQFSNSADPRALYLTEYIERGQNAEAKSLALVNHREMKGVTSYAGYLTVDKTYNSNLFFWYFPAKVNSSNAPVVLWLQGGPGGASLYGLFLENGPFYVTTKKTLKKREYSWHQNHNLLYIDNPVGAGFSFTDNDAGYATNQIDVGNNLFSAIRQFFTLFSELRQNEFYVSGESYAGKYIPALGHAILQRSKSKDPADLINLKGLAIGNGLSDPIHQLHFGDYLYQLGFIDANALAIFKEGEKNAIDCINQKNFVCALQNIFQLIGTDTSLFNNLTGFTSAYNYLKPGGYDSSIEIVSDFLLRSDIGQALHVGNNKFNAFAPNNIVQAHLLDDMMQSVSDWVAELLENYKVLVYNGQLDLVIGYTLTENYLNNLQFSAANEFKVAKRNVWKVDNEIAGYVKQAGNLTAVMIRNAGHLAPADQPKWVYNMILTLTSGKSFCFK